MTDQQIIEKLAVEVMGWDEEDVHHELVRMSWNPLTSIADAFMIMDKFIEWGCEVHCTWNVHGRKLQFKEPAWEIGIFFDEKTGSIGWNTNLAEGICDVALDAIGKRPVNQT